LQSLRKRYDERRNVQLLSTMKFLSDPAGYRPGEGDLEMPALREVVREVFLRLFPDEGLPGQGQGADLDMEEEDEEDDDPGEELSYQQRLAKQFDADLKQVF
jgi:hypothetical protein